MHSIGLRVRYLFLFCRAFCAAAAEGVTTKRPRETRINFVTSTTVTPTLCALPNQGFDIVFTVIIYNDQAIKCTSRTFLNPEDAHTWGEGYVRRNPGFFWEFE